jgi:hypothetical protein
MQMQFTCALIIFECSNMGILLCLSQKTHQIPRHFHSRKRSVVFSIAGMQTTSISI